MVAKTRKPPTDTLVLRDIIATLHKRKKRNATSSNTYKILVILILHSEFERNATS